jgi:hypothetical protein
MGNPELSNVLLIILLVIWYAKIWFHFRYLQKTNEELKHSTFISFFTNAENLFRVIRVVMPVFWPHEDRHVIKEKRAVWIYTFLLWLMLGLSFVHLYYLPEEKIQHIKYDLTK